MDYVLFYSLISVFIISLISFIGIISLSIKKEFLKKITIFIVAFSAGSLLAAAFFDLIPESFDALGNFYFVVIGILLFFVMEAFIHWHHPHEESCDECTHHIKPFAFLNLIADGFHNFLDGLIIVSSFLLSIPSGIATTIAIALHEIPQEIGDFAVLIHGGFKIKKAVLYNFLSSLFAIVGGLVGYFFLSSFREFIPHVISIAAGGLIYIATADLFPELHKQKHKSKVFLQILAVALGIILIAFVLSIFPE